MGAKFEHIEDLSNASPKGKATKKLLEKKGVVSPPLVNMVKINDKTWVSKKKK